MKIPLPPGYEFVDLSNETYSYTLNKILWSNDNLNIVGCAGSGKSTLLKLATNLLQKKGENVVLLSSTGIAAVNIASKDSPAVTLHSFFKIKPLDINPIESVSTIPAMYPVINKVDVFIIDEVSMVSSALFDYIIELTRAYKDYELRRMPRFILFSDILQLAPVVSNDKEVQEYYKYSYDGNIFFFNSVAYKEMGFQTIQLNHIFRQKDSFFQEILNRIRIGTQTNQDLAILNEHFTDEVSFAEKNDLFINLETTNKSVQIINEEYLSSFTTKEVTYYADILGNYENKNNALQEVIKIKPEMQVICLKNNYEFGYQNGTIAKVLEANKDNLQVKLSDGSITTVGREKWDQYKYIKEGEKSIKPIHVGSFIQIGAKPAAALTIHRSQGQTFEAIYYNPGHFIPQSSVYVALSRLRSIDGLGLKRKIKHSDIKIHREALDFLESQS